MPESTFQIKPAEVVDLWEKLRREYPQEARHIWALMKSLTSRPRLNSQHDQPPN